MQLFKLRLLTRKIVLFAGTIFIQEKLKLFPKMKK